MKDKIVKIIPYALLFVISALLITTVALNYPKKEPLPTADEGMLFYDTPVTDFSEESEMILFNECDFFVIPDKYNAGCEKISSLKKVKPGNKYGGVKFEESEGNLGVYLSKYAGLSGSVEIKNRDFRGYYVRFYSQESIKENLCFVFTNCIFDRFRSFENKYSNVHFVFDRCTFMNCSGSNLTLNNCAFTGGTVDGLVPYNNVYVNNCYFYDKCRTTGQADGTHTDATQIYGSKTEGCSNIHYENCRFEVPMLPGGDNPVNAAIMLQTEFCDSSDITFNNCIVNGGGYSIYARALGYEITDSSFSNISVGCSHRWGGWLYPDVTESITFENVKETDSLYASTSFVRGDNTYISVSNDTNKDRELLVCTNKGRFRFNIEKCPKYDELKSTDVFDDLPFDKLCNLGLGVSWFVCFDVTDDIPVQIRVVNKSKKELYLDKNMLKVIAK